MDPMTCLDIWRVNPLCTLLDPVSPLVEDLGPPVHSALGNQQVVNPDDQSGFAVIDMGGDDSDITAGALSDGDRDLGFLGIFSQRRSGSVESFGQRVVEGVDCATDVDYLGHSTTKPQHWTRCCSQRFREC